MKPAVVVAVIAACGIAGDTSADPARPKLTLRLSPVCSPAGSSPGAPAEALDVALTVPLAGARRFELDDAIYGAPGMIELVDGIQLADARGSVPIDIARSGSLVVTPKRAIAGEATLRYRARAVDASIKGAREGLRHDASGISGIGMAFLLLPDSNANTTYDMQIQWDVGRCPQLTTTTTSLASAPGTLDDLRVAAFVAGNARTFAHDQGTAHVRSTWLGTLAFDPAIASAWAARVYAAERAFFGDDDDTPYQLFIRVLAQQGDRANGVGQPSSFVSSVGRRTVWGPILRRNLAHEMLHRWIGQRLRLAGPDNRAMWFSEGFDVYYQGKLALRAKLISVDEFLDTLVMLTTWQFANPHAAASPDAIRKRFYSDDNLAVVPYTRGALYAAELDAAIRRVSNGKRSLDDVMRELYRAALASPDPSSSIGTRPLPATAVRAAVAHELGPAGVARYDAVIEHGAKPEPPSDAFGPCFERVSRRYAIYDLGLDPKQSRAHLTPHSPAAAAGVVEGDELVAIDAPKLDAEHDVTVTVRRGGQDVVIRYRPAAGARDGFTWRRVAGVADAGCSL